MQRFALEVYSGRPGYGKVRMMDYTGMPGFWGEGKNELYHSGEGFCVGDPVWGSPAVHEGRASRVPPTLEES